MKDLLVLLVHLLTTIAKLLGPGGARAIVADSLLMKQQLLVINRSRRQIQWINCGGIPLLTASRWGLSKVAKYSRCKHCLELKNPSVAVRVRRLVFRYMPVWQLLRSNAISWNVCAATSPDRPYLKSGCH